MPALSCPRWGDVDRRAARIRAARRAGRLQARERDAGLGVPGCRRAGSIRWRGNGLRHDRGAVRGARDRDVAVVETSDGSITAVYREQIVAESYDEATAQLTGMISWLDEFDLPPAACSSSAQREHQPAQAGAEVCDLAGRERAGRPTTRLPAGARWRRRTRRCSPRRPPRSPTRKTRAPVPSIRTPASNTLACPTFPAPNSTTTAHTAWCPTKTPTLQPWSSPRSTSLT